MYHLRKQRRVNLQEKNVEAFSARQSKIVKGRRTDLPMIWCLQRNRLLGKLMGRISSNTPQHPKLWLATAMKSFWSFEPIRLVFKPTTCWLCKLFYLGLILC